MSKWLLISGFTLLLVAGLVLSGCLIAPPDYPNKVANIVKFSPRNLEALPSGMIYEAWLVRGDTTDAGWQARPMNEWRSFGRFNWDPYNAQPTNEQGAFIANRFDAGMDIFTYDRIFITIETTGAEETPLPSGIVLLQGDVDILNEDADLEHPISTADIDDLDPTKNEFWIYSQSDITDPNDTLGWLDTLTGDMGIWFGGIEKANKIVFDTLCRDAEGKWSTCAPGQAPDTVYWCHFIDSILMVVDTSLDIDSTVEPPAIDTTIDTNYDTVFSVAECGYPPPPDYDSAMTHDTNYTIIDGDTTLSPSLTTMPKAIAGWNYQAWVIFRDSTQYPPLSLGRFTKPDGPDDDSSHCGPRFDRHFSVPGAPGEDFFRNVPGFGELHVVDNPQVWKLYITVEPDPDFAPARPYLQLIMFSAYIPDPAVFYEPGTMRPMEGLRKFSLVFRDLGAVLNEGHYWPHMHVDFERDLVVPK